MYGGMKEKFMLTLRRPAFVCHPNLHFPDAYRIVMARWATSGW